MTSTLELLEEAEALLSEAQGQSELGTSLMIAERREAVRDLIERMQRIEERDNA